MQKQYWIIVSVLFLMIVFVSCSNSSKVNDSKKAENKMSGKNDAAGPPTIIYKTSSDYYDKVAVTLSEDKKDIVNYPGIKDVYYKGELAYPTKLNDDFLLDNRGIDPTSAFLNITYEAYSKLEQTPSKEELFNMILDKDPFTEMYTCGSKYKFKDIVAELNAAIDGKDLGNFTRLK